MPCPSVRLLKSSLMYRAIMALPKWQKNGGRDFAFYHSHSGFEWDDLETTNQYQDMMCQDFQVGLWHGCTSWSDSMAYMQSIQGTSAAIALQQMWCPHI